MGRRQSALKVGKAAGAQRRAGRERTAEDEGHAYIRETSGVTGSRGLF